MNLNVFVNRNVLRRNGSCGKRSASNGFNMNCIFSGECSKSRVDTKGENNKGRHKGSCHTCKKFIPKKTGARIETGAVTGGAHE